MLRSEKNMKKPLLILALSLAICAAFTAPEARAQGMKIRFLGTGAADWSKPEADGEYRRLSSILVEDKVLIDLTLSNLEMIPGDSRPNVIFYTHSHPDHYKPEAALRTGIDTVFCSATWAGRCRDDFARAAHEMHLRQPVIIPLEEQDEVTVGGITFKALPANHYTGDLHEQALIYLLVKGDTRVLYATDTGGLTANAAIGGLFGADGLPASRRLPLSGLIMEATVGAGGEENFRLFSHSCVETVLHTANALHRTGGLKPDAPVYITHLARTLHPSQAELNVTLPEPLKAASDGLEVFFEK